MSATMEDALTEALLWLAGEPQGSELSEVEFGQFADRTGYWWTLRFRREIHNGEVRENRQDNADRIFKIVEHWSKRRAEMDAPGPETTAMPRVPS